MRVVIPGLRKRSLLILVTVVLLTSSGCSDIRSGREDSEVKNKFDALCRDVAGLRVNKIVESVEGYFDGSSDMMCGTCDLAFRKARYKFVEFEIKQHNLPHYTYRSNFVNGPGMYMASRRPALDQRCTIFYEGLGSTSEGALRFAHKDWGGCISAERISKLSSKYRYDETRYFVINNRIKIYKYTWKDVNSDYIYAEFNKITYYPEKIEKSFFGEKIIGLKTCPGHETRLPLVDDIFVPAPRE